MCGWRSLEAWLHVNDVMAPAWYEHHQNQQSDSRKRPALLQIYDDLTPLQELHVSSVPQRPGAIRLG